MIIGLVRLTILWMCLCRETIQLREVLIRQLGSLADTGGMCIRKYASVPYVLSDHHFMNHPCVVSDKQSMIANSCSREYRIKFSSVCCVQMELFLFFGIISGAP